MLVTDLKFEKNFYIAMLPLWINGSHPHTRCNGFWAFRTSVLMLIQGFNALVLMNAVINHDIPDGNYSDACEDSVMLLVGINTIIKFWFLRYHSKFMAEMINFIDSGYDMSKLLPEEEKEIVITHAKIGILVTKQSIFNFINALIFVAHFLFKLVYYQSKGEFRLVPIYDVILPDSINYKKEQPVVYLSQFILTCIFGIYASSMNTAFEPLIPIILTHIKGQVKICSSRMKKLFSDNKTPEDIHNEIKWVNLRLQKLYSVTEEVNARFGPLYEFILKLNTGLFPFVSFDIIQAARNGTFNVEFLAFFINTLLHSFVPCEYSELLWNESEKLREAIYFCNWERYPNKTIRSSILIMLTRTSKTMQFQSVFHPMCRDTFALVCRQSYTIFNILYAAWK